MSEDVFGFSETDAGSLIDKLNPVDVGTNAPSPVIQLMSVLVKVTSPISNAVGTTPGTGVGQIVQLIVAPGPTYTVESISPAVSIPINSLRTSVIPVDSLALAVRDQMKNEWWIS